MFAAPLSSLDIVVAGPPLVRLGLSAMYTSAEPTTLIAEGRVDELAELLDRLDTRPALVVLVSSGPDEPIEERLGAARRRFDDLPVLVLIQGITPELALAALEAGATGCYVLDAAERELVAATIAAAEGGAPIDPRLARFVIERTINGRRRAELLTAREAEVLDQVWGGLSNKQIARQLGITEPTVKAYLTRIYQRIGVKSRTEAAMWEDARRRNHRPLILAS